MDRRSRQPLGVIGARLAAVLAIALLSSGSSHHESAARRAEAVTTAAAAYIPPNAAPVPTTTATAAAAATTTTAPPAPATTATTSPTPATTRTTRPRAATIMRTTPPGFAASVAAIDAGTAARMTASWRPGCPVSLKDLRLVTVTHWGFDGRPHQGELVVHADHAEGIRDVFAALFEAGFPIEQVRLVDEFAADDDRSMAANNTSGFNCRRARGSGRWSEHAYGRAIDINPVQNPYLTPSGAVLPPAGRAFLERAGTTQGLITARGPVVAAFTSIGWRWGGAWPNPDYQHVSSSGR